MIDLDALEREPANQHRSSDGWCEIRSRDLLALVRAAKAGVALEAGWTCIPSFLSTCELDLRAAVQCFRREGQ